MDQYLNQEWQYEVAFPFRYAKLQGWGTLCFPEHFTPREQFALLPFAEKNSLLQIVLLQFAP